MLWLRIISLKQKNSQPLTQSKMDLLTLVQTTTFVVPEPILLQLRQIGNVVSLTKQHLYPEFPPLPTSAIAGHGGYFGDFEVEVGQAPDPLLHNLYEEIPYLGVVSEAVRAAVSNMPPGLYQSILTYRGK